MQRLAVKILIPTSDHQRRCNRHGGHIIFGHAGVVARMGRRQLADGQHRGDGIDSRHSHRVVGRVFQAIAVLEPGDEERRVALDDEAGLADTHAHHQVLTEDDRLDPWGN